MNRVEWIINAETKTCLENYNEILNAGKGFLNGVTVGRSDLSASMGIKKSDIESKPIYDATRLLVEKSKEYGLITNFGGNISIDSIPFILRLSDKIDRFETRKVVIEPSTEPEGIRAAIVAALYFELQYLEFKREYYNSMASEDMNRITDLRKRLGK